MHIQARKGQNPWAELLNFLMMIKWVICPHFSVPLSCLVQMLYHFVIWILICLLYYILEYGAARWLCAKIQWNEDRVARPPRRLPGWLVRVLVNITNQDRISRRKCQGTAATMTSSDAAGLGRIGQPTQPAQPVVVAWAHGLRGAWCDLWGAWKLKF